MMLAPEEAPTAGGAALDEVVIAALMAGAFTLVFAWITLRERQGHNTLVGRLADAIAKVDGLPRWVGLPMYFGVISVLSCAFGVWWDVPIHMQNGRDEGPLANPSHYFIFLGILGFLNAGILSVALARDPLPRRTIRLSRTWHAPMGALPIIGAGLIATLGFPADDVWHRLFGQDVTEWGPTHVMMIGGATTFVLGFPLLLAEAHQVGAPGTRTLVGRIRMTIALALCMVPIGFLMEFDLGVPQFPLITQYVIFGFLVAWTAVVSRLWFGPGGALIAAGLYLFIHAFIWLSVEIPLDDVLEARFLLYVPSAILVELVALAVSPRTKPLYFALGSGLAVGVVGLFAEWGWAHWFMPLPQPTDAQHLPLLLGTGTLAALGGALLATWHFARVREVADDPELLPEAVTVGGEHSGLKRHWAAMTAFVLFVGLMAVFAPPQEIEGDLTADIEYGDVVRGGDVDCIGGEEICEVHVRATVSDPEVVEDAIWFYGLAWQGRGPGGVEENVSEDPVAGVPGVVRVEMREVERGVYETADPLPLYASWKVLLRLHTAPSGHGAFPLYAPEDPAIESAKGRKVQVADGDEVALITEHEFLQRERRDDVPASLFTAGYLVVTLSWLVLLVFYGWCYAAAARGATSGSRARETASA